jgi:hypothetical protein
MATYDAAVRKALPDQTDLQDRREHCSVDAARLAAVGRAIGHQVRVRLSSDAFGLYTVSEVHPSLGQQPKQMLADPKPDL